MLLGTIPIMAIDLSITPADIMIMFIIGIIILIVGMYGLLRMIQCKYKKFVSMYLLCMIVLYFFQGGVAFFMWPLFGLVGLIISGIKKMRLL